MPLMLAKAVREIDWGDNRIIYSSARVRVYLCVCGILNS